MPSHQTPSRHSVAQVRPSRVELPVPPVPDDQTVRRGAAAAVPRPRNARSPTARRFREHPAPSVRRRPTECRRRVRLRAATAANVSLRPGPGRCATELVAPCCAPATDARRVALGERLLDSTGVQAPLPGRPASTHARRGPPSVGSFRAELRAAPPRWSQSARY